MEMEMEKEFQRLDQAASWPAIYQVRGSARPALPRPRAGSAACLRSLPAARSLRDAAGAAPALPCPGSPLAPRLSGTGSRRSPLGGPRPGCPARRCPPGAAAAGASSARGHRSAGAAPAAPPGPLRAAFGLEQRSSQAGIQCISLFRRLNHRTEPETAC